MGRLRLSVPRVAVPFVITPVLPTFRARHPRVEVEVVVEDRFVDIVAEGYDAGVRLSEAIERDMVQVRLTDAFRFVVVGAPELPRAPRHARSAPRTCCATSASPSARRPPGRSTRGSSSGAAGTGACRCAGAVVNDGQTMIYLAEQGVGLAYAFEPMVRAAARRAAAAGARGLRAHRARLLPLLPQPGAALRAAAPLRRGGEGAGRSPPEMTATTPFSGWPRSGTCTTMVGNVDCPNRQDGEGQHLHRQG